MNIAEKNLIITDGDLDVEVAVYAMVNEFYELVIEYCHNDDISPDRSFRRSATVKREETREMARLQRLAYRIIWVNPRLAAPGFEPLAGGMAAALPYCSAFVSGHSYAALTELADALTGPEPTGPPQLKKPPSTNRIS